MFNAYDFSAPAGHTTFLKTLPSSLGFGPETKVLRAPDAPQNVRFCRNPRIMNFQKLREKKEIGKIIFLYFPKIGRIRTNSDEIQKIKPLVFCSMNFCADGNGRVFFSDFPRISENWENCRKITDEFRGFFIFLLRFTFPDRDMTLYRFWWVGGRQQKSILQW